MAGPTLLAGTFYGSQGVGGSSIQSEGMMQFSRLMFLVALVAISSASNGFLHARLQGHGAPAVLNSNAISDAGDDEVPQVATDGSGNWVAIWYSNENLGGTVGTDWDIFFSRSTDHGANWSDVAALNSNASSDSEQDFMADISTDGAGNWVVVWDSAESLGGTIGMDRDIFFVTLFH